MPTPKLNFPPESNGYSLSNGEDVVEIAVEGGLARRRMDYSQKPFSLDVSWIFDQQEYQYFKSFYNSAVKKGSLPFLIDLIVDNPFLEEYVTYFKTGSVLSSDPMGLSIQVSATLEVLRKNTTDFDAMVLLLNPGGNDLLNLLEQLANYDLDVA